MKFKFWYHCVAAGLWNKHHVSLNPFGDLDVRLRFVAFLFYEQGYSHEAFIRQCSTSDGKWIGVNAICGDLA